MTQPSSAPPPIIAHATDLFANYDVLFCDVWGVVHNGFKPYKTACEALVKFRENGGTVILVSNAPVPAGQVANMLDSRLVPRAAWDTIVSSGAVALTHIRERNFKNVYTIGPLDRDEAFFSEMTATSVPLDQAEAVVCTGLNDDVNEKPDDYHAVLDKALAQNLEFVCVNPDFVVDVGGKLYYCAGAIADIYQDMGGTVLWAGKPYPAAYAQGRAAAEAIRKAPVSDSRILVVGDSVRTDLKGATLEGLDALFIGAGIHRDELIDGDAINPEKLAGLFKETHTAVAAMPVLAL